MIFTSPIITFAKQGNCTRFCWFWFVYKKEHACFLLVKEWTKSSLFYLINYVSLIHSRIFNFKIVLRANYVPMIILIKFLSVSLKLGRYLLKIFDQLSNKLTVRQNATQIKILGNVVVVSIRRYISYTREPKSLFFINTCNRDNIG